MFRVSANQRALELIPTTAGARYATEGAGALSFGSTDTAFDVVGPPLTLGTGQNLVFYNLGPTVPGSNAYAPNGNAAEQAASNRRTATNAAGAATTVTLSSLAGLPVGSFAPPYRVLAVDPPVTYRCDLTTGQLVRYGGYGSQGNLRGRENSQREVVWFSPHCLKPDRAYQGVLPLVTS